MAHFCSLNVKRYEEVAAGKSDREIENNLFRHYPVLDSYQRKAPQYRKWRRCCIVEGLKRGIITKDPGVGPPERR